MTGYVYRYMHEYQHKSPTCPHRASHKWKQIDYGSKNQWAPNKTDKPILPPDDIKYIQKAVENFPGYVRALDPTILVELGTLAAAQSKGTEETKEWVVHVIDYCVTNPYAKLRYHAINMILRIHSDASYLSELNDRICAGGHFS